MPGTFSNKAYSQIRRKLVEFDFVPPGYHIDIRVLADQLTLSPIPVREALIRLAEQDLIECRPGKGFFCKEVQINEIEMDYKFLAEIVRFSSKYVIEREKSVDFNVIHLKNYETCDDGDNYHHADSLKLSSEIEKLYLGLIKEIPCESIKRTTHNILDKTHYIRRIDIEIGSNNDHYIRNMVSLINSINVGGYECVNTSVESLLARKIESIPILVREMLLNLNKKFS